MSDNGHADARTDEYTPVTAADVTDLELLPKRFDFLAGEVRALIETLTQRVIPMLNEQARVTVETDRRIARLEMNHARR